MFTDLAGFSRGVEKFGIIHFLQTIVEAERLLIPIIGEHDGILLKIEGDSFLVIFRKARKAIQCSLSMHDVLKRYNETKPDEEKILLCIGLGYGRMLRVGDADVFSSEVNAASKLGEDIAKAWDILVTEAVFEECKGAPCLKFEELGDAPAGTKKAYRVVEG